MHQTEQVGVEDGIESAVQHLINKVESSQELIDDLEAQIQDLKLQLLAQKVEYEKRLEQKDFDYASIIAPKLQRLQEELDHYYLLSRKQFELIQFAENLQARASRLLMDSDR